MLPLRDAGAQVVVFGRSENDLAKVFVANGGLDVFPGGLPAMREEDVRALLLERTGPLRKRLLRCDVVTADDVRNAFVSRVASLSGGLPIYVNYVIGDMNAGRLHPEAPEALPAGLEQYHDELLRRAAVGDLQALVTPVLVLLSLACEPLPCEAIASLLARGSWLASPDVSLVAQALVAIGAVVRRAPSRENGQDAYSVFHHSLRTHVLGSAQTRHTLRKVST